MKKKIQALCASYYSWQVFKHLRSHLIHLSFLIGEICLNNMQMMKMEMK